MRGRVPPRLFAARALGWGEGSGVNTSPAAHFAFCDLSLVIITSFGILYLACAVRLSAIYIITSRFLCRVVRLSLFDLDARVRFRLSPRRSISQTASNTSAHVVRHALPNCARTANRNFD